MIDYSDDGDEISPGAQGCEPTPGNLAHWIEEQYVGDDRFESIEVVEPGPLDGEDVRVQFICDAHTHYLVSVLSEDGFIRIGLATDSKMVVENIEAAVDEAGGSLSDFLADALESDEDLEHEVQHFHDDMDYFASDIPYQREDDLASDVTRDEMIYYLDGYMRAFEDLTR